MKYVNQMILDRGIKPPKAGRDTWRVKQCPGLYLRVSASAAASWSVIYRVTGKQVKETLGPLADIPKVSEAVALAVARQEQARAGVHPVEQRRAATELAAANTLAGAVARYLARCERDLRLKTVAGYRQLFDHDVLPRWGERPLAAITKGDVLELVNDKAEKKRERPRKGLMGGATVQANRLLTRLRTFFGWCIANDLIAADPTAGVRKPAKETSRDRVLSDAEIRAFWAATATLTAKRKDAVAFGPLFRLLLLTGQREGEVAGMRWSEIDREKREWTLSGGRTKNGKEHFVHLSDLAMEVLPPRVEGRDLVFATAIRKLPGAKVQPKPASFARAKANLDAVMMLPDAPWTLHDLRRTSVTIMARLGIEPHIADKTLNHTAGTIKGVAATTTGFSTSTSGSLPCRRWGCSSICSSGSASPASSPRGGSSSGCATSASERNARRPATSCRSRRRTRRQLERPP
jgi:integrase